MLKSLQITKLFKIKEQSCKENKKAFFNILYNLSATNNKRKNKKENKNNFPSLSSSEIEKPKKNITNFQMII